MKKLLKSYKVEIKPTTKQIQKIEQSIGVCRWLYNEYLSTNNQLYTKYKDGFIDKKQVFMSANDFDKYSLYSHLQTPILCSIFCICFVVGFISTL